MGTDRYILSNQLTDDCVLPPDLKEIRMEIIMEILIALGVMWGGHAVAKGGRCNLKCGCRAHKPPLRCHNGCICNGNFVESDSH